MGTVDFTISMSDWPNIVRKTVVGNKVTIQQYGPTCQTEPFNIMPIEIKVNSFKKTFSLTLEVSEGGFC